MNRSFRRLALSGLALVWFGSMALADVTANLSDLNLGTNQYWNGSDGAGGFASQAIHFGNQFTDWGYGYTSWAGFSYSRVNDPVTPGYVNQYAVISGMGVGGTGIYAVVYDDGAWSESDIITLPVPNTVKGFYVNNTTYAALAMRDGDSFSRKFCAASNDWFMLTITAQNAGGEVTGTTNVYLADYRFTNSVQNYIVTNWTWVSLTSLGSNVKSLHFALSSSDNGTYGMNTPSYFAMDNLTTLESYAPAADQPGSTAVDMNTNAFIAWASGWTNYLVGANCDPGWQTPNLATGMAVGTSFDIVCLGEGGQITMTFDTPIHDGPGNDFAIFENSFSDMFLELAYVEVSSDGTNFTRFFNRSITPNPVSPYGTVNPEDVTGLGCKYRQGFGEPFDLGTLRGTPGLDVDNIRYVRFLDISGNGTCTDSVGHVIYDPYPSTGSAGFDLDAIGVLSNNFQEVHVEAVQSVASRQGPSNGIFRVTRKTWDVSAELDVAIVLGGTASNGSDYAWVTNTVHIPAGSATQDVVIVPFFNVSPAGDQTVVLQIVSNGAYQVEQRGTEARMTLLNIPVSSIDAWRVNAASPLFNNLPFISGDYWNGSDGSRGFTINGIHFKNTFTDWGYGYTSWAGFSYSRVNDSVTPGYANQYAVISGTGVGGTGTYVIAYDDGAWSESDIITLPSPARALGFYVNNTTYAALAMRDGDSFSRKFCAASNDWFKLTISAQDANGTVTGTADVYLADYRFTDTNQNYIVTNWTWVSLTSLGSNVKSLHFALSSSDNGTYGMNTPSYFAMDALRIDPASQAFSDTASWDGSGEANLMMYALGRLPGESGYPTLAPTNGSSFFEVTYRRKANLPDVGIGVETCSNLLSGSFWTTNGVEETVTGIDSGIETVRARISGSDTNATGFARLRAWRK